MSEIDDFGEIRIEVSFPRGSRALLVAGFVLAECVSVSLEAFCLSIVPLLLDLQGLRLKYELNSKNPENPLKEKRSLGLGRC